MGLQFTVLGFWGLGSRLPGFWVSGWMYHASVKIAILPPNPAATTPSPTLGAVRELGIKYVQAGGILPHQDTTLHIHLL